MQEHGSGAFHTANGLLTCRLQSRQQNMAKKAANSPTASKHSPDAASGDVASDDTAAEPVNFELAIEELETLVGSMESGELTLDQSLQAFERGIALTRQCQTALRQAELKVQALTENDELVDFEAS